MTVNYLEFKYIDFLLHNITLLNKEFNEGYDYIIRSILGN